MGRLRGSAGMRLGLMIYGGLDTPTGGYLYDRMLVRHLRSRGDNVEVISIPSRPPVAGLIDNFDPRLLRRMLAIDADAILQDELSHPSLCLLNERFRRSSVVPIISIVHHLTCLADRCPPLLRDIGSWNAAIFALPMASSSTAGPPGLR